MTSEPQPTSSPRRRSASKRGLLGSASFPSLVNTVLGYVVARMQWTRDTDYDLVPEITKDFSADAISEAKAALWKYIGICFGAGRVIGDLTKRKDSVSRSAAEADCKDIIEALLTLHSEDN